MLKNKGISLTPESPPKYNLQLAAKKSRSLGVCFFSPGYAQHHTMATLRLLLRPNLQGAEITILKCHSAKPKVSLQLVRHD